MVAGWLVVGSGRCGRVTDVVVAIPTSAIGFQRRRSGSRPRRRTGAGSRCRSPRPARLVVGGRDAGSRRRPPGRRGRPWRGWSSGTRSASGGPGAGPGRPGPCRSGSAPQSAKQNAPMNDGQAGQTPILGREGLLRLVEVVERLQARARGEEGGSSWTTGEDPGPTVGDHTVLGGAAGGQPPGGGWVAGGAGRPGGGDTAAEHGRDGRRGPGPGR